MVHEVSCTNVQRTSRHLLCVKDHHQDSWGVFHPKLVTFCQVCQRCWQRDLIRGYKKCSKIWDRHRSPGIRPLPQFQIPAKAGWFVTELHLSLSERRHTAIQNSAEQKCVTEKPHHMDGEVNKNIVNSNLVWISTKTEFFHAILETWDTPKYRNFSDQTMCQGRAAKGRREAGGRMDDREAYEEHLQLRS